MLDGNSTGALIPLPSKYNEIKITFHISSNNAYYASVTIEKNDITSDAKYFFLGSSNIQAQVKVNTSGITPNGAMLFNEATNYWCSVSYR